jgi:glycosyltransferase involved in cell wall biosynthesis
MAERRRRVLTNLDLVGSMGSERDRYSFAKIAQDWQTYLKQCANADLVIIDNDQGKVYLACLMRPFFRFRLVSVDMILRPPRGFKDRLLSILKRALFTQVDKFILYFKNTAGYERLYGIGSAKIDYVPFKVNGWDEGCFPPTSPEGDYVLCAGRTLRDVKTFVAAMEIAGCPGLLLQQQNEELRAHGTTPFTGDLPPNVRLTVDDGDDLATFLQFVAGAKLVVIPRFKHDIAATGISTYLMAMCLGKCVIISRGPGAEDLLKDEALVVDPEDIAALAEALREMWDDDRRRKQIADAGKRYADQCQGSRRLAQDIWNSSRRCLDE